MHLKKAGESKSWLSCKIIPNSQGKIFFVCEVGLNVWDEMCWCTTYKLEAAADGRLNVGAAKGGHFAKLPGDLDGIVEQETQATLVTETRAAGDLSKQDWRTGGGARMRTSVLCWANEQHERGRSVKDFSDSLFVSQSGDVGGLIK